MIYSATHVGGLLCLLAWSIPDQLFVQSFSQPSLSTTRKNHHRVYSHHECEHSSSDVANSVRHESLSVRRSLLLGAGMLGALATTPHIANAGIDVTGLPVEGGASMKTQLQMYSAGGSGTMTGSNKALSKDSGSASSASLSPYDDNIGAEFALRYGPGATLTRVGLTGLKTRYQDQILTCKQRPVTMSFEFPSDWLQLDKALGGIQFVDQRNGDKLYVLRAALPVDATLESVNKKWFGNAIFNPRGSFVRTGNDVEDYKVTSSGDVTSQVVPCSSFGSGACYSKRRRLGVKYATVTGNGLRVERRGLIDAYEVQDGDVFMMVTSTNAVKFEKQGPERETAEAIADSFRVGQ